ncbi:MAG: ABC transporter substrate-binding protein [Microthrixaceae bacterium]
MRIRTIVSALAVVLLASACGNSEGSSGTGNTDDDGNGNNTSTDGEVVAVDAPGVTDDEIRVTGIAAITNPLGADYASAADGVNAYFAMVNEDGGVHGRDLVLSELRDDKVANNTAEAKGIADADDAFAVLPVATLLFTGADTLVEAGIPTFGWTINPEWEGTEENPKANLFGQAGSYLCLGCPQPYPPYIAERSDRSKVGLLAYSVPQSATCAEGWKRSIEEWGGPAGAEVVFTDSSLAYGTTDLSVQVQKMSEAGVDLVMTCMDNNATVTLAKEMKKQGLDAIQLLPNAYNQEFFEEFGDLFEGSYVIIGYSPLETPEDLRPEGLELFEEWIDRTGGKKTENSMVGWLNASAFVEALVAAGPDFDRQKVIDALNEMTDQNAMGMLPGTDWVNYGHTAREPDPCAVYLEIVDGKMEPVEQDEIFTCFDVTGDELVRIER